MKKDFNILCTICARAGSKGVPNKNFRKLCGDPLISYTIGQAKESNLFNEVVISTDSDEIAEISRSYGAEVFFKRPPQLSGDNIAKIDAIKHAVIESEKYNEKVYDIIVDLDATSPLRRIEDLKESMKMFLDNNYSNLITATPSRRSPYFNLIEIDDKGKINLSKQLKKPIVRRQDSPKCYDMNASIYIWKRSILFENDLLFLENTGLYVMEEENSFDIDSELDFKIVEFLMEKRKKSDRS